MLIRVSSDRSHDFRDLVSVLRYSISSTTDWSTAYRWLNVQRYRRHLIRWRLRIPKPSMRRCLHSLQSTEAPPRTARMSPEMAHSCPGRVRRHVRSWRKPTPHSASDGQPTEPCSRIAQLDQRTGLPDQCLHSAEANVRPPKKEVRVWPVTVLVLAPQISRRRKP